MVKWYLPTFYGDMRLESQGKDRTMLTLHGLTPEERVAAEKLFARATQEGVLKKQWATPKEIAGIDLVSTSKEQKLLLHAPILDVQKILSKALKPKRAQLSVVKISGGVIQEVTEATQGLIEQATEEPSPEQRTTGSSPSPATTSRPRPTVAATVAPPVLGCPEPDFPQADVLATEVLREFLTPDQLLDFQKHQAFVAVGVDTGHRYQLTSRHARSRLAEVRRLLFDLDENHPLCVHDYDVPASEELLANLLHLQVPGRESYLRYLPE